MKQKPNPWNLSEEFLLESAEKRIDDGDYLGALTMLNRCEELFPPSADALAFYAEIYEVLEIWTLSADAWFRFLDICNEADFGEGYEGLALAFMNMGNEMQSAYYYSHVYSAEREDDKTETDGEEGLEDDEDDEFELFLNNYELPDEPPKLRIVGGADPEAVKEGLDLMRAGRLEEARERLSSVEKGSEEYPTAAGLSAMCLLMYGDEEQAQKECEALLADYPDDVQALTTYIAVLGARGDKKGAEESARHLAKLRVEGTDDLYRVATALCETELDEEAYRVLAELKTRLPYDENILYFHAVAAYRLGKTDEAISSLETLTTVYPRKAIAQYYLEHLRLVRDGEEKELSMGYFYRMPSKEYRRIANMLLKAVRLDDEVAEVLSDMPELEYSIRMAFDELEGRDEKLQLIAVKVAARMGYDEFLREVLLDYMASDLVKFTVLHEFTARNVEDSFGTVFLDMYREFFTHTINIGARKSREFLDAFADVYSKYGLLGGDNEGKLCGAAEDLYAALENAGAWRYMDEREALAAAIYRESRIRGSSETFAEICEMFDANRVVAQEILDFLM